MGEDKSAPLLTRATALDTLKTQRRLSPAAPARMDKLARLMREDPERDVREMAAFRRAVTQEVHQQGHPLRLQRLLRQRGRRPPP